MHTYKSATLNIVFSVTYNMVLHNAISFFAIVMFYWVKVLMFYYVQTTNTIFVGQKWDIE